MKKSLDIYDDMPRAMRAYISNYGFHFNKRACDVACKAMRKKSPATDKLEPVETWNKEQVEELLKAQDIKLKDAVLYDFVYVANMAKADYYKSSIEDEAHIAMFVRDYIDDADGYNEKAFRHWLADCIGKGEPIEWEELI